MSKKVAALLWELLFPKRCVYCNGIIGFSADVMCETCALLISKVTRPQGLLIQKYGREMQFLRAAYAPFFYERPVKNTILRIKFGEFSAGLPNLIARMEAAWRAGDMPKIDCLIAVPSTQKERKGRNIHLPQTLAKALGAHLEIPLNNDLYKKRETQHQMSLTGQARRQNVKDAYDVTPAHTLAGKTVLLIDDVLTTGSTLNECAKALCKAGAAECFALTIAVTK
ncbi:MAG: phosphoribosyltransferase family protein [Ruthenibacterium sp.]